MLKFISGLAIGGLLAIGVYSYSIPTAALQNADERIAGAENLKLEHSGFWSGVYTNLKLEKKPAEGGNWVPKFSDDTPILSLTTSDPLLELTRSDIKSICINTYGGNPEPNWEQGFFVEIYLTSGARRLIGKKLQGRDGKTHSIRVMGAEINSFIVDGENAKHFADNADKYQTFSNKMDDGPHAEQDIIDSYDDISFRVENSSTYQGLDLVRILSGTGPLLHCNPEFDLNNLPGFTEHSVYWENLIKQKWVPKSK